MMPRIPSYRLETRAMKFAYSNARVKGMKTSLLQKPAMEQIILAGSVREVLGLLDRTPYKQDLAEPALRYSGADLIEVALGRHMARQGRKVLSIIPPEAVPTVTAILEKWDLYNLKTILLGKHLGHGKDDITSLLVPAGSLTPAELRRLTEQKSVEDLSRFIGRNYGKMLMPLLDDYKRHKNVQPLLNALEKDYFMRLPRKMGRGGPDEIFILSLVKSEIDMRNIMNVLRGKKDGAKEEVMEQFIISGGNMVAQDVKKLMACRNIEDVIASVRNRYNLDAALERYRADRSLVPFEIEMERRLVEKGLRTLRASVLSTGAIVGYLYLLEAEISNIRKVVRAKEFSIPPDKLRETLVTVN